VKLVNVSFRLRPKLGLQIRSERQSQNVKWPGGWLSKGCGLPPMTLGINSLPAQDHERYIAELSEADAKWVSLTYFFLYLAGVCVYIYAEVQCVQISLVRQTSCSDIGSESSVTGSGWSGHSANTLFVRLQRHRRLRCGLLPLQTASQ